MLICACIYAYKIISVLLKLILVFDLIQMTFFGWFLLYSSLLSRNVIATQMLPFYIQSTPSTLCLFLHFPSKYIFR